MNAIRLSFLAILSLSIASCSRCSREKKPADSVEHVPTTAATPAPDLNKAPDYSGITVERVLTKDKAVGKGAEIKDGSRVSGYYGMWVYAPAMLANKGKFISGTSEGKEPHSFQVGKGEVIKGWEQGVVGMRVGGKRSIIVPISLGYGEKGTDIVPPGSILLIEFEAIKAQ